MEKKKKITIAVVAAVIIIAIAIIVFLLTKNTKSIYTISFDTNGGKQIVSQEIEDGKTATKPVDPTKEGYEFLGWYLGDEEYDFSKPVKENLTLDAKWKEIEKDNDIDNNQDNEEDDEDTEKVTKYTVTFDSNGGSSVSKQTVEKNKKVTAPKNPTRTGYTFKGWYLGSTKYNFSNKVTKNITLTAKWEKVEIPVTPEVTKYTVTFDSNGGTSVAKQTIEEGKTATAPKNPTRTGYTFIGWYHNGTLYNFNTQVTGNVTLVAKWEKNAVITYKIENTDSFVGQVKIFVLKDGEKVAGIVDITLADGTFAKDVSIPKTGYITNGYDIKTVTNVRVK